MLIRNGCLIDPESKLLLDADIFIRDQKIHKIIERNGISPEDYGSTGDIVIDAQGCLIGPGLADTHVHFRDPGFAYKEDILTGAEAAKAGGYTQIILMANTKPRVDNVDTIKYVLNKGKQTGINIHTCANVTLNMEGRELTEFDSLKESGAVGFTDDGIPLMDEDICYEAMKQCAALDVPISFHEENPNLISNNGINAGAASEYYGIEGSPREAEIDLIGRDIELALRLKRESGMTVKLVIQHISTKEGVELVAEGLRAGLDIHAEATPHHFSLTEDAVIEKGALAKMNPPLRTKEDRAAICQGLRAGVIDIIATDHAPHSKEEKEQSITKAPSGIIGLETALGLAIRELVNENYLSFSELFNRMSLAPCRLYGLEGGRIVEGAPADLVIFNPSEEWEVQRFKSKACNSPFTGQKLPGRIHYTICNGSIVYQAKA